MQSTLEKKDIDAIAEAVFQKIKPLLKITNKKAKDDVFLLLTSLPSTSMLKSVGYTDAPPTKLYPFTREGGMFVSKSRKLLNGVMSNQLTLYRNISHSTSGRAGGLNNVNRSKRIFKPLATQGGFNQINLIDRAFYLLVPGALCILLFLHHLYRMLTQSILVPKTSLP